MTAKQLHDKIHLIRRQYGRPGLDGQILRGILDGLLGDTPGKEDPIAFAEALKIGNEI
ncbi:hypothetical protein IAI38_11705, partial [Streptococcus pseudopneumoniae]|nr:hypothetical protein [Streptococcus pseudopneumoniae]